MKIFFSSFSGNCSPSLEKDPRKTSPGAELKSGKRPEDPSPRTPSTPVAVVTCSAFASEERIRLCAGRRALSKKRAPTAGQPGHGPDAVQVTAVGARLPPTEAFLIFKVLKSSRIITDPHTPASEMRSTTLMASIVSQ